VFLLVIAQQPGHKLHCNAPHIELLWQILLTLSIQQFDNVTKRHEAFAFSILA
jgi:hypothetical protein